MHSLSPLFQRGEAETTRLAAFRKLPSKKVTAEENTTGSLAPEFALESDTVWPTFHCRTHSLPFKFLNRKTKYVSLRFKILLVIRREEVVATATSSPAHLPYYHPRVPHLFGANLVCPLLT
jgi:hypothetical protein